MIFAKLPLFLVLVALRSASGSLVVDSASQKGIYLSDYCPSMKYCVEGSHVMCMYYDPNHVMGPRCSNPQNVSITAELANQLLDVTNAIRSKLATGKETGKDGVLLPRGYGIFRLRWDNELATFAQVLANQCVLRHDLCRSTKRFPDPGQTAGLVRFTFPDWYPMSRTPATSSPGLNEMKLSYAVTQTLKSWYAQKASVTEQMLTKYPDWTLTPTNQGGRLYMEMIYGSTTHMGCGISAYTEYSYYDNNRQMNYNSIQVICNYSARPRKGGQSYSMDAPRPGHGYTSLCGCPEGSREDADCLCTEYTPAPKPTPKPESCTAPEGNCEPTLVLLPIFTVEDAPSHKLYEKAREIEQPLTDFVIHRLDNLTSLGRAKSVEVFDILEGAGKERAFHLPSMPHPLKSVLMPTLHNNDLAPLPPPILPTLPPSHIHSQLLMFTTPRPEYPILPAVRMPPTDIEQLPTFQLPTLRLPESSNQPHEIGPPQNPLSKYTDVLRSQFYEKSLIDPLNEEKPLPQIQKQTPKPTPTVKKSSIFTRVAQFKLPGRRSMSSPFETLMKDVVPRKDFSNLSKVVDDYLNRKQGYRRNTLLKSKQEYASHQEEERQYTESPPQTNTQEQKEEQQQKDQQPNEETTAIDDKQHKDEEVTETVLNNVEEKVITFKRYLKRGNNSDDTDVEAKEDNDNKLMSLLDTLEQEVKHIELDGNEKELFDAKIRKIYGTVVGKPVELLSPKQSKLNELELPDNDFGESKTYVKHESNHISDDERNMDDDKKIIKHIESKKPNRIKAFDFLERKHKDKIPDALLDSKYNDNIDHKLFNEIDRKYNEHIEHKLYSDSDRRYSDLEHKFMEDLDRKLNEDRKYKSGDRKFYNDHSEENRKYSHIPASRNQVKYENKEYRNYKHNSFSSVEDVKHRNFDKYEREKFGRGDRTFYRKDLDRKHRRGTEVKRSRSKNYYVHNDANDVLSVERRKYYQDKLENLERRLQHTRSFRRKMEHGNERPMRRMRPNREDRTRGSKTQADNFYMPDRARFLHGF
ncbi:uncharacterized protein LOC113498838 isoform X2 [Trichoplusia ni]|uniref:Uncharacterized protein LOC113498838 isoform X2 n=1 Tax=Trichoplusia ni TaxID=7111 RepID=A0A7E5W2G3_TRINI|nr:uncharacterized protein LOC113498838 isoform X2 [Trichoplusia ni]